LLLKQYVRDYGLALINEFITFISEIHGIGIQWKGLNTWKFNKLVGNINFEANCQEFPFNCEDDPSKRPASDICPIFNVCNTRNARNSK